MAIYIRRVLTDVRRPPEPHVAPEPAAVAPPLAPISAPLTGARAQAGRAGPAAAAADSPVRDAQVRGDRRGYFGYGTREAAEIGVCAAHGTASRGATDSDTGRLG